MNTINYENFSHCLIINEMIKATGCTYEQAKQFLISTQWNLQVFYFIFRKKFYSNFVFYN